MTHGVVVHSNIGGSIGPGLTIVPCPPDPNIDPIVAADLLPLITYWDIVAVPRVNGIGHVPPGLDTYVEAGVVIPVDVQYAVGEWSIRDETSDTTPLKISDPITETTAQTLDLLRARDLGHTTWAIADFPANHGNCAVHRAQSRRRSRDIEPVDLDIELALRQALPVPAPGTPPEKVLRLKEKRRPELLEVRSALADLRADIQSSDQIDEAVVRATERLELALLRIQRVMDEGKIRRLASLVSTPFSTAEGALVKTLFPAAGTASGGALAAPLWDIDPMHGALAGIALNSVFSIIARSRKCESVPDDYKQFLYLYYVAKKLGSL